MGVLTPRYLNLFHLGIKELRSMMRDPVMMILIGYAFTISIYAAAEAMPETLNKAPIVVVDEDRSQLSEQIIAAFYPPYFKPPKVISAAEMDAQLDRGLATFALYLPHGLQRDLLAGRQPSVQLNIDATRMSQAFSGSSYIHSIVAAEAAEFSRHYRSTQQPPVSLVVRSRFNPQLQKAWFGSIMELINHVTLLGIVLTGAALIREREHGTVEHLLVMPVTPFEIMFSKVWSMGLVVLVAAAIALLVVVEGWLAVPVQGSLSLFLVGAALHLFAVTSLGVYLGCVARSMPQFGLLLMLVLLPMQMLSGATTPRESMPQLVRDIMLFAPDTHFVQIAQGVLFRDAGLTVVWPHLLALVVIGLTLFLLSLRYFRRSIATMG